MKLLILEYILKLFNIFVNYFVPTKTDSSFIWTKIKIFIKLMNQSLTFINVATNSELKSDLNLAIEAASKAGEIIRENFGKVLERDEKSYKGDVVTKVDRACEARIIEIIQSKHPNDAILSEETNSSTKETGRRLWVIDPMDGTAGFLEQRPEIPSVMIALRENYETILSVVYFPMTDQLFYATEEGAFINHEKWTRKNHPTTHKIAMNGYPQSSGLSTPEFTLLKQRLAEMGYKVETVLPNSGTAMQILTGELDAIIHDNRPEEGKTKQGPWDIIPIMHLIQQAGGVVLDMNENVVDPYHTGPFVVATNQQVAQAIIGILQKKRKIAI